MDDERLRAAVDIVVGHGPAQLAERRTQLPQPIGKAHARSMRESQRECVMLPREP